MSNIAQARRNSRIRRHRRVRKSIHGTAARPRLAVFRSNKHLTVQVIDDDAGVTLAAASSVEASQREAGAGGSVAAATRVGELVAERAKAGSAVIAGSARRCTARPPGRVSPCSVPTSTSRSR